MVNGLQCSRRKKIQSCTKCTERRPKCRNVIAIGKLFEILSDLHGYRYECNPEYTKEIATKGLKFVGEDVEGERMEIVELEGHPFFVGCQVSTNTLSKCVVPIFYDYESRDLML